MSKPLVTVMLAAGALVITTTLDARADDKRACLDAHAKGQELRISGKFREAAKRFRVCASATCPQPITLDCTRWEQELRALTPTIVIAAEKPDGTDTVDARLIVDGAPIAERLPSTAIALDPGEHTIRIEAAGLGPAEQRIVVRERELDRKVTLRFAASPTAGAAAPTAPIAPAPPPVAEQKSATLGVVLVSAGVVASGVGITFGVLGKTREDELAAAPCGKTGTCAPDDVDVVRQRYWIAGIAGGVGVACLALGIWQLVSRGRSPSATSALSLGGARFTF